MKEKRVSQANVLAKECIVEALMQLIKTKPLSTITISELCDKAGVSRITFYRNYDSKEDIFKKHLEEIFDMYKLDDLEKNNTGNYYDYEHMRHYFDYLIEYKEFLVSLITAGFDTIFLEMLNQYIVNKWIEYEDPIILYAFSGSLYNEFRLWAAQDYDVDPEYIIRGLVQIYTPKTDK